MSSEPEPADFSPVVLIPIYNNSETICGVVESLSELELPCIIVDDGSDSATQQVLEKIDVALSWVEVYRRAENGGKGAALVEGFRLAGERGYSHVVQIDADGQHDVADIPLLLDAARTSPGALVLGRPVFDETAPRSRRYGRLLTTFWVRIETLSFDIGDALCGFRCYPVAPTARLLSEVDLDLRMAFDPEIAVRLHWLGLPTINVATTVQYPKGGVSHFHYIRDNLGIAWMHTRLILGMLRRLPARLSRARQ